MALVFRREKCAGETAAVALQGIDPAVRYEVLFEDSGTKKTMSGAELARLAIAIPQKPGSALVFYEKAK
jgi:hypothetical protein